MIKYIKVQSVNQTKKMFNTIERKASEKTETSQKRASNFQQLFKIQMMKKERKTTNWNVQIKQPNQAFIQKLKQRSKKIINLLLNCPQYDSYFQNMSHKNKVRNLTISKQDLNYLNSSFQSSNKLVDNITIRQKTVSNCESKLSDSIEKIKQFNRAYDKQKSSLLQRSQQKKAKRKILASLPNNLLATSISPLNKYSKNTIVVNQGTPRSTNKSGIKASFRYKDIPISQFIYDNSNLVMSQSSINRGIQKRLQQICRRKNSHSINKPRH